MYALDTNTLIYYFKGIGNVASHLLETPPREIGIPAVVLYEIEVGIAKSNNPQKRRLQLENFTKATRVLPLDENAAKAAADIRSHLESQGMSIGPMDTLIAGIALAQGATLVTRNKREFSRVKGLKCVDWY